MKNQALFSLKDKGKKLKCRLLQFLFGTLWVMLAFKKVLAAIVVTLMLVSAWVLVSHFIVLRQSVVYVMSSVLSGELTCNFTSF